MSKLSLWGNPHGEESSPGYLALKPGLCQPSSSLQATRPWNVCGICSVLFLSPVPTDFFEMQLYHLELVNNNIVALNILTDSKIIFSSYCSGSIVQNTFDLHERYSWRLWYLGWSMHNSDIYKYVHFDDYLLQPLGLNSLWREREKEVALYSLGCHTVFYICYWRRKCYKIMKCFCKLPGKHHHELWYTLSGFHIVRLPLDSQLGLYILSWEQFWISYFLFSSDFPYAFCISFAYYFSLNAFAIAFWCILFFLSFCLHVCVCLCACMCTLASSMTGHPLCMPYTTAPSQKSTNACVS